MTGDQGKQVLRRLRSIPIEAIKPQIVNEEAEGMGMYCLVGGVVEFVVPEGRDCITNCDEGTELAQIHRWLQSQPERVHGTRESARAFVRSKLGTNDF